MNQLNDVSKYVDDLLTNDSESIVLFCEVEKTAYEVFFYATMKDGNQMHSSQVIESGIIGVETADRLSEQIAEFIRSCDVYDENMRNVVTITADADGKTVDFVKHAKDVGLYKIKKDWKSKYVG